MGFSYSVIDSYGTNHYFEDIRNRIASMNAGESICILEFCDQPEYNLDVEADQDGNVQMALAFSFGDDNIFDFTPFSKDEIDDSKLFAELEEAQSVLKSVIYDDRMTDLAEKLGQYQFDIESFGENVPNNWQDDVVTLNNMLEIFSVHEYNFVDVDEIASVLWEDYCNGNLDLSADEHYAYVFNCNEKCQQEVHYDLTIDGIASYLKLNWELVSIEKAEY